VSGKKGLTDNPVITLVDHMSCPSTRTDAHLTVSKVDTTLKQSKQKHEDDNLFFQLEPERKVTSSEELGNLSLSKILTFHN